MRTAPDAGFVDTNVLVYAHDAADRAKRMSAAALLERLVREQRLVVSAQVLSEFCSVAAKKVQPKLSSARILAVMDELCSLAHVVPLDGQLVHDAVVIADRHQLSHWDAQIVAAALSSGSRFLLSEDFQDGRDYDGVTCLNPFAPHFAERFAT